MLTATPPPVPILATERLTLRGHTSADLAESAAMWADPEVTRYIGGHTFSEEEVWTRILRYVGHWALRGFGYWVVRETATNRFIGEVGFADYKRDIVPSFSGTPEIGWVIAPGVHGRGFATEAVRAAIAWADAQFDRARTICMIDPQNARSIRVAEKCGYREFARTTYRGAPTILFERLSPGPMPDA